MGRIDDFNTEDNRNSPKTAYQRNKENDECLNSLGIPVNDHLPLIEEEFEAKIRTGKEIAERIIILTYLNFVAEVPDEKTDVIDYLKVNSLWDKVSPEEKELFQKEDLTNKERINISWRSEAIWILLWTINKVDEIELPTEQIEIKEIISRLPDFFEDPNEFTENAIVRPTSEILDISDLIYRLHWAVRHTELNNLNTLEINSSVVVERHYAINWVTFYADEWDEITTDT